MDLCFGTKGSRSECHTETKRAKLTDHQDEVMPRGRIAWRGSHVSLEQRPMPLDQDEEPPNTGKIAPDPHDRSACFSNSTLANRKSTDPDESEHNKELQLRWGKYSDDRNLDSSRLTGSPDSNFGLFLYIPPRLSAANLPRIQSEEACLLNSAPVPKFIESLQTPPRETLRCYMSSLVNCVYHGDFFRRRLSRTEFTLRALFTLIVALTLPSVMFALATKDFMEQNSVYVPGGGFSGFWFTLGRLQSLPTPTSMNYYCYSAGCLGVVATLVNRSMNEMLDSALEIQSKWDHAEISRFSVVPLFLDDLLQEPNPLSENTDLLSLVHIITSVKAGWFGLKPVTRTPLNYVELREMLIQTTWIPLVVGDDVWYLDHMDGAFTMKHHPTCDFQLGVPFIPSILLNTINVNLGRQKASAFWEYGLKRGL